MADKIIENNQVSMMGKIAAVVIAIGFFGGIILTYLFGYNDKMLDS